MQSSMKPDKAFVMAAGFGSRLQPLTLTRPKPLVEVAGQPLLSHIIDALRDVGVRDVTINAHYLSEQIESYAQNRDDVALHVSYEPEILDTGGGLKQVLSHFKKCPFYVINGDAYWVDKSLKQNALDVLFSHWDGNIMDILMLLQPVNQMVLTQGVGDYDLQKDGQAVRRLDKGGDYMFTSLRINHPRIFDDAPDGAFSYLQLMDAAQAKGRLYGVVYEGDWHHISTPVDLQAVNESLSSKAVGHKEG